MNPMNPSEIAREKNLEEQDKEYETKLNDSEYKDAEQYDAQFGDKYNENFLKDLAKNKETPEVSLAEKYAEEVAKETKKKK